MPKITLVFFEGCPGVPRAREALRKAGISDFSEVSQDELNADHPYRRYLSPTILVDGKILAGTSNGAAACTVVDWKSADLLATLKQAVKAGLDKSRISLIALLREPDPSILHCELTHLARLPIDFQKLQSQHQAYAGALGELGVEVQFLPPLPGSPDGVFVEDAAIVLDEVAILARPGAASRRHETETVLAALQSHRKETRVLHNGTLDGGDVLRVGRKLFVGQTSRTTPEAVEELRKHLGPFGYEVTAIEVHGCLHLKTAITFLGDDTLIVNPQWIDIAPFRGLRVLEVDAADPFGANAIRIGAKILYGAECVHTAARLERAGFSLFCTPISELAKAEAGLTCLSLLFRDTR